MASVMITFVLTCSVIGVGMIFGMFIINWGVRKGYATQASNDYKTNPCFFGGILPVEKQTPVGVAKVPSTGIGNLAFQMAIVLACMLLGNTGMGLLKKPSRSCHLFLL